MKWLAAAIVVAALLIAAAVVYAVAPEKCETRYSQSLLGDQERVPVERSCTKVLPWSD